MRKLTLLATAATLTLTLGTPAQAGFWDSITSGDWAGVQASLADARNNAMAGLNAQVEGFQRRNQTLVPCLASDKTGFIKMDAVAAFEQAEGSHNLKWPTDERGKLPGSVNAMNMAEAGDCHLVSPDAAVVGASFDFWSDNIDNAVTIGSSYVVASVHPQLVDLIVSHYKAEDSMIQSIADISFAQLVRLDGKTWGDVGATGRYARLPINVHATDTTASASGNVVAAILAYEYAFELGEDPDPLLLANDPGFQELMAHYYNLDGDDNGVDHSETSTSRLTSAAGNNPGVYHIVFTYETKVKELSAAVAERSGGQEPGITYGWAPIMADHKVMVTADDPYERAAAVAFVNWLLREDVQSAMANKLNFRPVIDVPVTGALLEYQGYLLPTITDPDMGVVAAAQAFGPKD